MENTNDIVSSTEPPFETSSGGSLNKETLSSYQKKTYNDALAYATKNNDPSPQEFAKKIVSSTGITYGKNNPFGELATKTQPGTIKNGVKYRDYPSIDVPFSKKYEEYLQEQNNQQIEEQQFNDALMEQQLQEQPQEQPQEEQLQQEPQQFQQQQNSIQFQPQQAQSVYERNYSDQQIQNNNSSRQLQNINPIQQMAYGGYSDQSYEGGGKLNAFNVGGTHEQNPLQGIPQGMGSNGKPNSVEQDETSFDIDGQKFIFSNRIMTNGTYREHPLNKK